MARGRLRRGLPRHRRPWRRHQHLRDPEADLGSVSRGGAPAATATPTDGGYLVNGRKIFVTGAPGLHWLVTLVGLPPCATAPHGEVAGALVKAGSLSLTITESWSGALSLRSCGNSDVDYVDVFVAEEFVVERRPLSAPPGLRKAKAPRVSDRGR